MTYDTRARRSWRLFQEITTPYLKPALEPVRPTHWSILLWIVSSTDATLAQILVVTFTEKATAELKTRIRALIERIIEGAEFIPPLKYAKRTSTGGTLRLM